MPLWGSQRGGRLRSRLKCDTSCEVVKRVLFDRLEQKSPELVHVSPGYKPMANPEILVPE